MCYGHPNRGAVEKTPKTSFSYIPYALEIYRDHGHITSKDAPGVVQPPKSPISLPHLMIHTSSPSDVNLALGDESCTRLRL